MRTQPAELETSPRKEGLGTFTWADGSSYTGHFSQNLLQGYGDYRWPDGRRYVGQWDKNALHGCGEMTLGVRLAGGPAQWKRLASPTGPTEGTYLTRS